MKKMFAITQDGYFLASDQFTPDEFINSTLQAQMQLFHSIQNQATTEEEKTNITNTLYDLYNSAASAFLEAFAPEIEMRPDLTAEAILKAENDILDAVGGKSIVESIKEAEPKVVDFPKFPEEEN